MTLDLSQLGTCQPTWRTERPLSVTPGFETHELFAGLITALVAESDQLFSLLANLPEARWDSPPAAGRRRIRDRVTQLAYYDDATLLAVTRTDDFRREADQLLANGRDIFDFIVAQHRVLTIRTLLAWATDSRCQLTLSLKMEAPHRVVGWFGPDISVESAARLRLDETRALHRELRALTILEAT
jgi:hypothetical protein